MPIDLLLHSEKISTKHFAIILANMGEFVLCATIYRKGIDKCALLTYSHGENTMGFCFIEPADKRPVLRALHKGGNRRSALYKTCAEKTHSVRGGRMSKGMVSWTSIIFCGLAQGEWTKNMDDKTMHLWGTSVQIVWVLPLESTAFHTSRRCVIVASITAWKNARKEPFRSPYRIGEKV